MPQIIGRNTQEVIFKSSTPYLACNEVLLSLKAICGWSSTSFKVFVALVQVGEFGPKYPKSLTGT